MADQMQQDDRPEDAKADSPVPIVKRRRGPKVDVELTRQRKADIVREAARLFDEVGYHGVSMEMIAEAAGLKKPTLYHYIKSKDEILFVIHDAMMESLSKTIKERVDGKQDQVSILKGVFEDIFQQLHDYPGYVRATFEHERELGEARRKQIQRARNAYTTQVIGVIAEGMAQGRFRKSDPRLTALCMFGICNWAYQWYRADRYPKPAELADQCWNIFANGLLA